MAGTQKTYQVRFEVRGFSAVAKSFSALNKDMEQTLKSYRTIGNVQARDSRGRFVKNRFALSSNNRFSQSENSTRFSSQGGLLWDRQRGASVERTAIEYAANIQGSIIGEHISKALRVTSDRRQNIAGTRTVLRDAFEFALTSTMSGAFQRMGEAAIADPILNAMRQAFQENRKLEKRGIHPAIKGGSSGIGFAAKSVAFGGLQLIGSKFSEVLTEDLMRGFKRGFEKTGKNRAVNFEKLGESAGSFVSDPLAVAKDKIRERKISKLDDSLAEAEKLSRDQKVTVKPGKVKVFTVGGLGGSGIADYNENLARIGINPDIADIENTENPHTGTNIPLSDPLRFASDAILNKYVTNEIVKGQNQDAINLAAKVIAARRENPNARINLLGHSAGADIVQQAIAILEKGGYADNVQGIGVGGINIGTGFDVKNFRNIAGDNDYVVKATSAIGSQPTATDYGQVSKLGDHKLRTYFAHPDFIKSLDKDLQPTAVAKILDNFYEDMIQEYGNEALPVLEEALRDGLKFAGEFDRNFGNEETDRINQVLAKYHQQLGMPHQGINAKANPASIVNRQFERIEEVRSLFRGIHQQPDRGSPQQSYQVMSPDPLSPLNYQFMQPDPLNPVPLTTNAVNRVDQGNVDQQFDRVAEMMAGAKERARAMLPSQLAARQQGAPVRSNDVPQLVVAYQQKIIRSFKENLKAQMESMFASMEALAQAPTDDGGDEFANQLRLAIRQRARGIFAAYTQAIQALEGVSVSADQVDNTTLDQVKTDFNAIVSEFQQAVTERVVETIGTLDELAQSYASEAPAAVAGAGGNRFVEDFNAQIDDQVMTFQANLDRLFGEVLETNAKKLDDLAALRAQMGLPRLASQRSLGDRYGERLQGLIQGAKTSAGQRIRGLIPGFESMDPQQRSEQLKKLRSEMTAGLNEFRRQMAAGDSATARKLGESLVQRIEAVRAAYDDLSKNFTGDKRAIGGSKAQLTKLSKELQQGLQSIAANATGSLAGEIESELNAIQAAGSGIGDALIEGTEDSLEISSPSKVFQRIGQQVGQGFEIGLAASIRKAGEAAKTEIEWFKATISKDLEYLRAVATGDTAKAQAMVGDAAKGAGYNVGPVYHGTGRWGGDPQFTEFESRKKVNVYRVDGKEVKRLNSKGESMSVYDDSSLDEGYDYGALSDAETLGAKYMLEFRSEKEDPNSPLIRDLKKLVGKKVTSSLEERPTGDGFYFSGNEEYGIVKQSKTRINAHLKLQNPAMLSESAIEVAGIKSHKDHLMEQGYDGAIFEAPWHKYEQVVAFEPNQIKSADAVTKTDDGKPVPLSARFDDTVNDIRGNVNDIFAGLKSQSGEALQPLIAELEAQFAAMGDNSIQSLIDSLEGFLGQLQAAGQSIGDALIEGTEDSLDISSPSKVFQQIGENIIEGLKQGLGGSNPFEELKKTIEEDIEYLQSLVEGNAAKSRSMVGNAAKKSGFNVGPVYHGTDANFTRFDPALRGSGTGTLAAKKAFWFTSLKESAENYPRGSASRVIEAFLSGSNNFSRSDFSNVPVWDIYQGHSRRNTAVQNAKRKGKSGVEFKNMSDFGDRTTVYAVFNPNQIKSANRFTRTDSGLIVPVSQRFNGGDDIRGNVDISSVRDYVKSLLPSIADNLVDSLTSAIEAQFTELQDSGRSIGDALIEGTEDSLEISSPSKVFQRIGQEIARGLGIGLRENLEEVKQELTDNLSELDEEAAFQATRVANKFNDMGGFPGLDEKAAEGIDLVRDRLSGLAEEFPAIGQLVQIATQFGGSIALLMGAFSGLGKILQLSGFSTFISAIATLPDTAADAGRELQSLAIAFESVTGSSALSADAMEYISRTAEKFGISIRSAEEAYLGLVATTRGTELEGLQTDTIFEAFAQTAALRGLDEQQQQQMFTAVQQVLGKGKLSAEEVRGQLGEIPALAFQQTLAESLGVNLQQLDKLLSSGSLQSDAIFKVAQQYASANAQMAGSAETAQAAITRLDNAVIKLQRSFGSQFLEIQRKGALFFAGALEKLAGAAETIVKVFGTGLVVVLADVVLKFFASHLATKLLRIALVALGNAIAKLGPLLRQMAGGIVAVNVAIELWNVSLKQLELDDAEKGILNLSDAYTKLGGSIEGVTASTESMKVGLREIVEAAQSGDIGKALRLFVTAGADETREDLSGLGGFLERFKIPGGGALRRFFGTSTAEADLNRRLAFASAGAATSAQVQVDQQQAMKSADRMIQIEQQMVAIKTRRASLTASDGEELERTNELLKELREEYNGYLQQVSNARQNTQAQLTASKAMLDKLRADRAKSGLSEQEKQRLDAAIQETEQNIRVLENGQDALDQAVSRLDTSLSTFTRILSQAAERIANIRERLTNEFNEYRAALIKTGLSLGSGDQTIRLELDRADFRELEAWIRTLRQESQRLTEQLQGPDLQPQVENLRKAALEENVEFGSAFFQRIANDTSAENREAAQALLQLQDLENQIAEGEVQLAQNTLQARQTIRDLNRQIADFIQQLTAELDGLLVDLREQVLNLAQSLRRTQLQKAIVGGSKGLFGSVVGSVQGFLDAAGQLAQQYLGQERRKLEFEQKKYDLGTRMREFIDSIGGATDAVQKFIQALGGGSAGAAVPSTARGGETFLGITGNSGRSTGPHLDIRKRGGDRRLTAAEIDRFRVDGKPLSSYPITSEFGPRWGTHHGGVDFGTSVGQKITTTVPVERVSMREPSQTGGGGYVVDVLFADGLEVSLLHLSPDIKTAGVGRSVGNSNPASASGATAELLARIRSGEGDYNAINHGYAGDTPGGLPGLTNMSIAQVMALQALGPSAGAFAVGAYQFIPETLAGAVSRSGIDRNRKFDKAAQDELALELIFGGTKRPHLTAYLTGKSNDLNAALSDISHEWAAVTGANGRGVYDGDSAGNMASISVADLLPQVRAQFQGQGGQLAGLILQSQADSIATESRMIGIATQDLQTAADQFLEQTQREFENIDRQLIPQNNQLIDQLNQYASPDQLREIKRSLTQEFTGLNNDFQTQIISVEDSIKTLENLQGELPGTIADLQNSGFEADSIVADRLQKLLDMMPERLTQLREELKTLESYSKKIESTKTKEERYRLEQLRLQNELRELQVELQVAEGNRNIEAIGQIKLQILENEEATERLQIERDLGSQTEERNRLLEQQNLLYDQKAQSLQFETQGNLLEDRQFQADMDSRIAEAEATQAESFGGDNGIFGFRATELREQNALLQEQLRYEQEILDLRIRYVEQPDVLGDMLSKAERLNTLNLQNIDSQFKTLGETIAGVAEENLGQFFEDIFSGTKSAGEAFRNLAQSILRYFAQIAARNLTRGIFSRLGGIFGGAFGGGGVGAFTSPGGWSGFKYGGTVPNYAQGGRVLPEFVSELLKEAVPGVKTAFIREGSKAALGVFTPGEEVLSLRTGEAQRYQLLKKSLGDNPLQSIMAGSFAFGGTVGINPEILSGNFALNSPRLPISSVVQMGGGRSSFGGNVTINYEVKTPDANSFRRSQFQIDRDATIAAQKVLNRK